MVPDLIMVPANFVQKARTVQNNNRAWGGREECFGEENMKQSLISHQVGGNCV